MTKTGPVHMRNPHIRVGSPQARPWLPGACLALAVSLVFVNCLWNGFVWDDEQFILKNQWLTSWRLLPALLTHNVVAGAGVVGNLYRPLQSLTHLIDVQLWGYRPWGHHLSTVLFHVAASIAVFRLFARLYPAWPAALAAASWALHPMQSEVVAYACGRVDTLALLFLCMGLMAFERHRWLSLLCAAFSMASKEYGVLFPVCLLLYEHARGSKSDLRRALPHWLLSGAYVAARLTILNFHDTLNFYHYPTLLTAHPAWRVFTYLTTLPKGLLLWLWPADLHHERSWSVFASPLLPQVWLSLLLVLMLLGVALWLRTRRRTVAVGILWFFLATAPTSNVFVVINALFYDHWFLFPGLGLAMIVGHIISSAWSGPAWRRRATAVASGTVLLALSLLTVRDNRLWRSPLTLYPHILRYEPRSAKIHNNLGMAYADAGRLPEAIQHYKDAIALSDEFPETHHNLGNAYLHTGDDAAAQEEFERAVALNPHFHHAWIALGFVQLAHQRLQEAADAFEHARRAYPYAPDIYLGLAQVSLSQGDSRAALAALDEGLRLLPDNAALRSARARMRASPP